MDEAAGNYAKWNSHRMTNAAWLHLYEVPRIVRLVESGINF